MRSVPHVELPMRLDRRGEPRTVEQDTADEVAQSVRVLMLTRPGDRLTQPAYGLADPAFAPAGETPGVVEAVERWEPRATLDNVDAELDDAGRLDVDVRVTP